MSLFLKGKSKYNQIYAFRFSNGFDALLLSGCTENGTPAQPPPRRTAVDSETGRNNTDITTSAIDGVIEETSRNGAAEDESSAETEPETEKMSSKTLSAKLIGWGLGSERDSQNRPVDALNAQLNMVTVCGFYKS